MQTENIRKTTSLMGVLSLLPHIFCCVLPIFAVIIGLGATIGLGAALASNPLYQFVDNYHWELLGIAVGGVTLSGILSLISYKIDCREASSSCSHASCAPKKLRSFRIFFVSCVLLVLDMAWYTAEPFILGVS